MIIKPEDINVAAFVEIDHQEEIVPGKVMDRFFNEEGLSKEKETGWWFLVGINFWGGAWDTIEIHESKLVL